MDIKELEKMTSTKLRELIRKEYPEIKGVHAMKKEELFNTIIKAAGIEKEEIDKDKVAPKHKKKKVEITSSKLKKEIKKLKVDKEKAIETKDKKTLIKLRKKIKKLKRHTRKLSSGT
jgi:hypothetical protein